MNRGKVGEEREGKEMDRCPLTCRAKSVDSVRSVVLHVLHTGIFLLDADMKSVLRL
jgi:hypothetical protein